MSGAEDKKGKDVWTDEGGRSKEEKKQRQAQVQVGHQSTISKPISDGNDADRSGADGQEKKWKRWPVPGGCSFVKKKHSH